MTTTQTSGFVSAADLQRAAQGAGYAVGAFNINNLESLKAVATAAKEERSPVIVSITPSAIAYGGIRYLAALVEVARDEAGVPMALHLDHGNSIADCEAAIGAGFSSVMIDGSKEMWEGNVAITEEAVRIAHSRGVAAEAELGLIPSGHGQVAAAEVPEESMTDPDKAREFVAETGVDTLAVAIGNAHGWYKGRPKLDFGRLEEIRGRLSIPIVLHGASGIPEDDIRTAISLGVSKINIDTELRGAFRDAVAGSLRDKPDLTDPRDMLRPAIAAMTQVVAGKMRMFGSSGRAGA